MKALRQLPMRWWSQKKRAVKMNRIHQMVTSQKLMSQKQHQTPNPIQMMTKAIAMKTNTMRFDMEYLSIYSVALQNYILNVHKARTIHTIPFV